MIAAPKGTKDLLPDQAVLIPPIGTASQPDPTGGKPADQVNQRYCQNDNRSYL